MFIPQKGVFDKTKFYIYLRIRVENGIGAMKKRVHQILFVTKRGKARKIRMVVSA